MTYDLYLLPRMLLFHGNIQIWILIAFQAIGDVTKGFILYAGTCTHFVYISHS